MTSFPPLYVLRHGQTEWNAEHRIQGRLDSPLTTKGRAQAGLQNAILKGCDLTGFAMFSSPQGRAFHTASIALDGRCAEIDTDRRLSEIACGDWDGLKRADLMPDGVADESEESALDFYDRAPRGEGFIGLHARCSAFLADLRGPSVLITHGITSRMLRLIVLGWDISQIGELPGGQGIVFYLESGEMKQLSKGA